MATPQAAQTDVAAEDPSAQSAPSPAPAEKEDTQETMTTTSSTLLPPSPDAQPAEKEDTTEVTTPAGTTIVSEPTEDDAFLSKQLIPTTPTTTTTQPTPTPDPELGLKVEPAYPANAAAPVKRRRHRHRFRKVKAVLLGIGSVLFQGLSLLWIGLLYGIPGAILVALGIAVFIGIPLAFAAAYGSVAMLMGNGILRAAHMAHYTNNASAAAIGATGVAVAGPALGFLLNCVGVRYDDENPAPWYIRMVATVLVHTVSAPIGCAILLKHHVDLGPIDVLHATRAGALGGTILGPGSIVAMPVVSLVLGIVLSPLWIAMMMGLRWCYTRSSETFDGTKHTFSYCVSYGTCGDDDEIDEEVAMAKTPRYGFNSGRRGMMTDFGRTF